MTRSLYSKFICGYLLFGLLGFIVIATFSNHITHHYLREKNADAMYDEANLLAASYSDIYTGKTVHFEDAAPQLDAVGAYLNLQIGRAHV